MQGDGHLRDVAPHAIVIGCHINGLGVIRSLAMKGFHIVALFYDEDADFAQTSKHVHERAKIPHPRQDENAFVEFLLRNSTRWKNSLIIETNDDVLIAISKNKERLAKEYRIGSPGWSILNQLIEKPLTYGLATECGVPFPRTFFPETRKDLDQLSHELVFPCLVKPALGHLFFKQFHVKLFKAENPDDLSSQFDVCLKAGHRAMIQEIIPGPDSNLYQCMMYVALDGSVRTTFTARKIRQNPPGFGVARVEISHDLIPVMAEFTVRMLAKIGFTGMVHSEFKLDPRNGVFKLLEINGRLARGNWLAAYCGVNFPWLAYMDLAEGRAVSIKDYPKNVYWIELSQDISNSIRHRRAEHFGFREYLEPYRAARKTFADVSADDPIPFFKRIANGLTMFIRR